MGATGYGGVFERFAELLADEFTVVTYDRRGNGRSPRPPGWDTTSPEEQADDAAALLDGSRSGPGCDLRHQQRGDLRAPHVIRHPESVRGAVLHEPALFSLFDDPTEARDTLTALIKEGMASGGPPAAFERFIRFVAGDANWERLDPSVQQRMLASADTYFGIESGAFDSYLPDDETLAAISTPDPGARKRGKPALLWPGRRPARRAAWGRGHSDAWHAFPVSGSPRGTRGDGQAVPSGYQRLTAWART